MGAPSAKRAWRTGQDRALLFTHGLGYEKPRSYLILYKLTRYGTGAARATHAGNARYNPPYSRTLAADTASVPSGGGIH